MIDTHSFHREFGLWASDAKPSAEIRTHARRYVAQAERGGDAFGRALRAAREGDVASAEALAREALGDETRAAEREGARAIAAAALATASQQLGAELYDEAAGWRPDGPLALPSLLLFAELSRNVEPWCLSLIARAGRTASTALRLAAQRARIAAARRVGLPKDELARLIEDLADESGAKAAIGQRLAAIVYMTGASALTDLLIERFPPLVSKAEADAVVARLLLDRRPMALSGETLTAARLVAATEMDSALFWNDDCAPERRIAVVGNSPCDVGRGLGREIDSHDLVLRFNGAPEDSDYAADYGVRCDAKMMAPRYWDEWGAGTRAPVVLVRQMQAVSGDCSFLRKMRAIRKRVVFTPSVTNMALHRELGRTPSSGLIVLATLKDARGSLAKVGGYGFSLVDQLGASPRTHYYDAEHPAGRHEWRSERALFDRWFAAA